jgi:sugar phosphate isomerase/epimerase
MPRSEPTELSRRKFLALSGAAAVAALTRGGVSPAGAAETAAPMKTPDRPIGLELYSVRKELERDLPATLSAVAGMGYELVEFYAPYFDWTIPHAKEVRRRLDDLGLRCESTHNTMASFEPGAGLGKAIELNQILGTHQIILAHPGRQPASADEWKAVCARLSEAVTTLRPHGLTAGFHNHQTEWQKLDGGERAMDVIAANTPEEFVLQLDVGTCVEAGADPVAWIKSHPGRIRSMHLKDWAPGSAKEEKGYRVLFGEGASPWREIIAAAESVGGVEFYLLEQESSRYSELETVRRELELWKKFRASA